MHKPSVQPSQALPDRTPYCRLQSAHISRLFRAATLPAILARRTGSTSQQQRLVALLAWLRFLVRACFRVSRLALVRFLVRSVH